MGPQEIVQILIEAEGPVCVRSLIEASVHLPRRSSRWVASFRGETGRQVWRTTGLREPEAALALAKQWEAEAGLRRAAQGGLPRKPTIRVRPGSGERDLGLLTQHEVAAILRISERGVREIERRAFKKLQHHPALRKFWIEHQAGQIKEAAPEAWKLNRAEIAAIYELAKTLSERQALRKLMALAAQ